MSARTASATRGYWTLTATSRPSSRSVARYTWPIDAAAIGSLVEVGEHRAEPLAELGLDDLAHVVEADVGRGVAQLAELALELLAVLLRHHAGVDHRQHLADLHCRALHRPEHGDDLLRGLDVALVERGLAALVAARHVGGQRGDLARALAGGEPADARRAPDAAGRDRGP